MAWIAWAATYDAAAPVPPRLAGGGTHAYFVALPSKIRARRGPPQTIRVNALLPPTVVAAQTDACSAAELQANDAQAGCAVPEASEHGINALLRYFWVLATLHERCTAEPAPAPLPRRASKQAKATAPEPLAFAWHNGFRPSDKSWLSDTLTAEAAAVLFNIAALYSRLACDADLTTIDGLKTAAAAFQRAAGALAHLMLKLTPHLPTPLPRQADDLGTPVLRFLERLMVAQAAECYYQRLVLDQSVPTAATVLPQVAAVIENHYNHLKGLFEATVPRGAFTSSPLPKEWATILHVKRGLFLAIAQQAIPPALPQGQLGEHLARLAIAKTAVHSATLQAARLRGSALPPLVATLSEAIAVRTAELDRVNRLVYHERVPKAAQLPPLPLPVAALVSGLPLAAPGDAGAPIDRAELASLSIVASTLLPTWQAFTARATGIVATAAPLLKRATDLVAALDAWEDPSAAAENVDAVLQAFAQREQSWPFVALVRALDTPTVAADRALAEDVAAFRTEIAQTATRDSLRLLAQAAADGSPRTHWRAAADDLNAAAHALRCASLACDDLCTELSDLLPPTRRPWAVDAVTVPTRLHAGDALVDLWPHTSAALTAALEHAQQALDACGPSAATLVRAGDRHRQLWERARVLARAIATLTTDGGGAGGAAALAGVRTPPPQMSSAAAKRPLAAVASPTRLQPQSPYGAVGHEQPAHRGESPLKRGRPSTSAIQASPVRASPPVALQTALEHFDRTAEHELRQFRRWNESTS